MLRKMIPLIAVLSLSIIFISSVAESAPLQPGLVASWHFNEREGTIATDSSGNGHDGMLEDGAAWEKRGRHRGAVRFDGVDDHVRVDDADDLTFNEGEFTLELWFKLDEKHEDQNVAQEDCPVDNSCKFLLLKNGEYGIVLYHDGYLKFYIASGDGIPATYKSSTKNSWDADTWYHVAAVYENGDTWKIYINGELNTSGTQTYFPKLTDRILSIGAFVDPIQHPGGVNDLGFVDGVIDEVCIHSRAKDAKEILHDYRSKRCAD